MADPKTAFETGAGISPDVLTGMIVALVQVLILVLVIHFLKRLYESYHAKEIELWQYIVYVIRVVLLATIFSACIINKLYF